MKEGDSWILLCLSLHMPLIHLPYYFCICAMISALHKPLDQKTIPLLPALLSSFWIVKIFSSTPKIISPI
jgi:hypothetical protein